MNFLCGCDVEKKQQRYGTHRFQGDMPVCPEHGLPLSNFMSPTVRHPQGHEMIDWSKMRSPGKFVPVMEPESVERQRQLRDLDRQADEILKNRRLGGNGSDLT
jgi:hypothetical protein